MRHILAGATRSSSPRVGAAPRGRRAMLRISIAAVALAIGSARVPIGAQGTSGAPSSYVSAQRTAGAFPLAAAGRAATLYVSAQDHPGVIRAVNDLRADLERVTGSAPTISTGSVPSGQIVIVG